MKYFKLACLCFICELLLSNYHCKRLLNVSGELAKVFGSRTHLIASVARMIDHFWTKQNESKNGTKTEIVCEIRKQLKLAASRH